MNERARIGRRVWVGAVSAHMHSWPAVRRCLVIALVVGTVLTLINEGDVIFGGGLSSADGAKIPLNYIVPFVVSSLGYISAGLAVGGARAGGQRDSRESRIDARE